MSRKLLFASCKLLFTSCKFKEMVLRVASCFFRVESLDDKFTSWKFKMITFTSWEVAFYKLNINDANFTNYHHIHGWIKFQGNESS